MGTQSFHFNDLLYVEGFGVDSYRDTDKVA